MRSVDIAGKVYNIPSEMEELSSEQYLFFVKLLLEASEEKLNLHDVKVFMIVKILIIVGINQLEKFQAEKKEAILDNLSRIVSMMDFLFEKDNNGLKPNLNFTKNLLPSFKVGLIRYHGPADTLSNISFQEYIDAHSHYTEYLASEMKNTDALNRLIAVLYRPQKFGYHIRKRFTGFDGQRRKAYNDNLVEIRAEWIKELDFHVKYGIFLWYHACENFFRSGMLTVEGKEINLSKLYSGGSSSSKKDDIGLAGILYSLAETQVFGNVKETARENIFDVMLRLYQVKSDYDELQRKSKQK